MTSTGVEYLVVGGYAVNYYGYSRATADIDIWVAISDVNSDRVAGALREFGFSKAEAGIFREPGKVIRMGVPPVRLKVLTSISGVDFEECYPRRVRAELDGVAVDLISLEYLKRNKAATGRLKDLLDLEQLS